MWKNIILIYIKILLIINHLLKELLSVKYNAQAVIKDVCLYVRACVRACLRAFVRACVSACVRVRVCVRAFTKTIVTYR